MIRFRKFASARSGSVAIQIAIVLTILIGFAALGADVTYLYFKQRQAQAAADASAFGGAVALSTGHPVDFTTEARGIAATAGFVNGTGGVTVTVNNPPTTGNYTTNDKAVEVIINQPQQMSLINLFRSDPFTVTGRAVAVGGLTGYMYCILALDPTAADALVVQNNGIVANPNCGLASNSSSSTSLVVLNGGQVLGPVSIHGQWSLANNAVMSGHPVAQNAPTVADPFASVAIPTPPACTGQSGVVANNATRNLTPGHFCSGFVFNNGSTVNLGAGTYYVDTQLVVWTGATINATSGVTLVVNGNYAINIKQGSTLNITAPTTGALAGIAMMSSQTARSSVTQTFSNNVTIRVVGALYFPNQTINFVNNSATAATQCTMVIGRIVNVNQNVYLNNDCVGTGVPPVGSTSSKLVE